MRWLTIALLRLRSLFQRDRVERELRDEIQFHLDRQIAEHRASGMTPGEARAAALRRIGGIAQIQEQCRDARGLTLVYDLCQDVRYSLRMIRRKPGYALGAMLCMALGIGVNTTVFSYLDGLFLRKLPVPNPNRIVAIDRGETSPGSWQDYLEYFDDLNAFSDIAVYIAHGTYLDVDRANDRIVAETVSANYADVLKIGPAFGRWLLPSDNSPTSDPVAVISDRIWGLYFDHSPDVLGESIRIENQWYRIVGVMPREFRGISAPLSVDAWVPFGTYPEHRHLLAGVSPDRGPAVFMIGRLTSDASLQQAASEISLVDARLRAKNVGSPLYEKPASIRPFVGISSPNSRRTVAPTAALLISIASVLLLIACVNVTNILLSWAAARRREIAVRQSLGASPGRLIRQVLAEGSVIATGGAILGLILGHWTNLALLLWLPSAVPGFAIRAIYLEVNWRVGLLTAGVALACAVLFSSYPAIETWRRDVSTTLKGRFHPEPNRLGLGLRDFYVAVQVAMSFALLVVAGLFLRALQQAEHVDPGFATEHRIYIRLFTPEPDYTPGSATREYSRLLDEARALPGVRDATLSFAMLGFMDSQCVSIDRTEAPRKASLNVVEPNYFQIMQVPLIRGRNFSTADLPTSPHSIIVNQTMANLWWPDEDPIGKTVWLGCNPKEPRTTGEVIAVARDSKYGSLDESPRPFFYVYWRQVWWNGYFALILHTDVEAQELAKPLLELARSGGSNMRTYELQTLENHVSQSLWPIRAQAAVLGVFGPLAVVLAAIGLYGVVSYAVSQRTCEFGLRMALGAQGWDILRMVLQRGMFLTTCGIVAGLILAFGTTRFLSSLLYGLSPLDPATFGAASVAWMAIAMLASYLPARRATHVDPNIALRED